MADDLIDIPISGEGRNTLTIRLRKRKDGQDTYQARRIIPVELWANPRNPYITKRPNTLDLEMAEQKATRWERTLFTELKTKAFYALFHLISQQKGGFKAKPG